MLFKMELLGHVDHTDELILKTSQILTYIQSQITKNQNTLDAFMGDAVS